MAIFCLYQISAPAVVFASSGGALWATWAFLLLSTVALNAQEPVAPVCLETPRLLSQFEVQEDLELAISAVEHAMPELYWHQSRTAWHREKIGARTRAQAVTDDDGLLRVLRPLLYSIGEGHMSVISSEAMKCRFRKQALLFPLDMRWRSDGIWVIAGYGEAKDVPFGSRLLSIDNESAEALLRDVVRFSPHDGVIQTGVMRDMDVAGYAALRWKMKGQEMSVTVRLQNPDGAEQVRTMVTVPREARLPSTKASPDPVARLRRIGEDTAYLYVPTFSNRRYRAAGADFRTNLQQIFTALATESLHGRTVKNLILDLRDNGGGAEPNESVLFSYLVQNPMQKYAYVRSRQNELSVRSLSGKGFQHTIYDDEELKTLQSGRSGALSRINRPPLGLMTVWTPLKPVFTGRVVVLAGGKTFSGGAELASLLYAKQRAYFIGEEVAGTHAGNTSGYHWQLTLPNSGIDIEIPLLAFRFVWPDLPRNHGVPPDCLVQPSIEDAVERGTPGDRDYETALDVLQHSVSKSSVVCKRDGGG